MPSASHKASSRRGNKRLFLEMIAGTNAVASHSFYRFGGRLRGVLAGARGTWAGVVLGHKTAVLAKLPQAGQPCCGNLSTSTVSQSKEVRFEFSECSTAKRTSGRWRRRCAPSFLAPCNTVTKVAHLSGVPACGPACAQGYIEKKQTPHSSTAPAIQYRVLCLTSVHTAHDRRTGWTGEI